MFQTGTIIGQSLPKNTFKVMNRQNKQIWSTPMDDTAWQNFALTLDYSKK
jgi:Glycoside hydrolase 131 catalytic N-terminal domain